jgi:hypothetical protein
MKSVLEFAKKGPSVYSIKNVVEIARKKGRNVASRVSEPTYKRQNVITPRKPPPPPP